MFSANTVHFVMFEYSVNHCDIEWFYSPVHLWLLSFFFIELIYLRASVQFCACCLSEPVLVQGASFYHKPSCHCICMAVSNQMECFSRKRLQEYITPHTRMPVLSCFVFHCHCNVLIHPCACLHVLFLFLTFLGFYWSFGFRCLILLCAWVPYRRFISNAPSASSQFRYILHNPRQSRRWPLWNGPGSSASVDAINGTLSLDVDVICQKHFCWKGLVLFFFTVK